MPGPVYEARRQPAEFVNQAVADAVSDGGIADLLVPARDRQLESEDGGTSLVAILTDLSASGKTSLQAARALAPLWHALK